MKPQQPPRQRGNGANSGRTYPLGILLGDEEWYSWKRYASSELSGEAFLFGDRRPEIGDWF
jgi:hypothetical protein